MKGVAAILICFHLVNPCFAQDLIPCAKDGLFGFCDKKGNVVVEHRFQKALSFRNNVAPVVNVDGYWWFINRKGHLMFNTRRWADQYPPEPEKGLFVVRYFDPVFADVTEYYNKDGLPVKVSETGLQSGDTIPYVMFSVSEAISRARSVLGTPYGVDKLDCSGFIRFIFEPYGITLPYYAREIALRGREIALDELRPGDLVFFGGDQGFEKNVNHVGMVISGQGANYDFIHASSSKGIIISRNKDAYFQKRFLFVRRIFG